MTDINSVIVGAISQSSFKYSGGRRIMWPFRRFPRLKVLVIGGVHLDTIIDVPSLNLSMNPADPNYTIYSPGTATHSIGGTGFNVAENMARNAFVSKREVGLYTVLAKDSAITRIIRERLIGTKIYRDYVHEADFATSETTAGGFVGVRDAANATTAKSIRVAATDTPVNQTPWAANATERARLERAIKNSEFIVTESHIEIGSLTAIINFSEKYGKPLFVSLSSEPDAAEFLSRSALTKPMYALSCRLNDLQAFAKERGFLAKVKVEVDALAAALRNVRVAAESSDRDRGLGTLARVICDALNSKHVVCVDMHNNAYAFLSVAPAGEGSAILKIFDEHVVNRATTEGNLTGIRDGIFSAFVHLSYRPKDEESAKVQPNLDLSNNETRRRSVELASRYMGPIAKSKGATPGAVVSWAEAPVHWTQTVWRYLVLISEAAPLLFWFAPILFVLAAWLFAWIGIAFQLPGPSEWSIPDLSILKKLLVWK